MSESNLEIFGSVESPLLILDIANNHNGSVAHGKQIIDSASAALDGFNFKVAIKFQYRDLDTLIHPKYKGDYRFKYIQRFEETRLSDREFLELLDYARRSGFLVACTPFDERSVQKVVDHGFDILKVASACATDWPLLSTVVKHDLPVVVSTGGLSLQDTDRLTSFMSKRIKDFALMHCVAIYPTPDEQLALNRIAVLKERYKDITIGYSTHENPNNVTAVGLALAKGATIFERHIGLGSESIPINKYSSETEQLRNWAESLNFARSMLSGMDKCDFKNPSEQSSVRDLARGVYARSNIAQGLEIGEDDVFFAIPVLEEQVTAGSWSKQESKIALAAIPSLDAVTTLNSKITRNDKMLREIVEQIQSHFSQASVRLPNKSDIELSHHFGIERFHEFGITMATIINRSYCKKIIAVLPGQTNPEHVHQKKDETFIILTGDLTVTLQGEVHRLTAGDVLTVHPGSPHSFTSQDGAVFEEISSRHYADDSYYTDKSINENKNRKTNITVWINT
jgi:N-acetylneuraminate synthase